MSVFCFGLGAQTGCACPYSKGRLVLLGVPQLGRWCVFQQVEVREGVPVPRDPLRRELLAASVGIVILLTALKHIASAVPQSSELVFTIAIGVQLYVPFLLIGRFGITFSSLGFDKKRLKKDGIWLLTTCAVVFPVYAFGFDLFQSSYLGRQFSFQMPSNFFVKAFNNIFVIGLSEELFFRGYLQERWRVFWARQGRKNADTLSILWVSILFAAVHFLGEYNLARLAPFFPSLLFGLMRAKTGSVIGAAAFHGFCNILSDVLWSSYSS